MVPWWNLQGSPWAEGSISSVHFDRQVIVMLIYLSLLLLLPILLGPHIEVWRLNSHVPVLIRSLFETKHLFELWWLFNEIWQSVITGSCNMWFATVLLKDLFPTSILPDHHQIQVNYIKTKKYWIIKTLYSRFIRKV